MPGLTKSLDLQDNEDIEIPEYVEFTADVKNFESTTALTVATSDIFSKLDLSDIGDADDLQDKLDELSDATDELVDGAAELTQASRSCPIPQEHLSQVSTSFIQALSHLTMVQRHLTAVQQSFVTEQRPLILQQVSL